eukprot:2912284-Pyramimonas_sp.AAC.1
MPNDNPLKQLVYEPGEAVPKKWNFARKKSHPKLQWANCVYTLLQKEQHDLQCLSLDHSHDCMRLACSMPPCTHLACLLRSAEAPCR